MTIDEDLEKIALQEKLLQFKSFDANTAWAFGIALKAAAEKRQLAIAIDIQLHGFPLFYYAMPGTTPDNADWIRRKRNVVSRFHRSSYAIGLKQTRASTTLHDGTGLDAKDYAAHGGCFPYSSQAPVASAPSPFPASRNAKTTPSLFPSFRISCRSHAKI